MNEDFKQWAIVELMGYRKIAGLVTIENIAGTSFLRIDIENSHMRIMTQYYNPTSVYSVTPISEEVARKFMDKNFVQPITTYDFLLPKIENDYEVEEDDIPL